MRLILLTFLFVCQFCSYAQDSLKTVQVEDVEIRATRIPVKLFQAPIAIQNIQIDQNLANNQNHSLIEFLSTSPGLFALNQYNSAQDLRLSIRGFGARSAFGIRGVRVMMDDIPLSTPDGQGQVDNIFVGGLENITILNGTSSALYGNASGGVVSLRTFSESEENENLLDLGLGSFGDFRTSFASHLVSEKTINDNQISYARHKGFREHSGNTNMIYNGQVKRQLKNDQEIALIYNAVISPKGEDPGGVNLEAVQTDRQAARPRNVEFNTGEELRQITGGLKYLKYINSRTTVKSMAYFTKRNFNNRLPFENGGQVELSRNFGGVNAQINHEFKMGNWESTFLAGLDFAWQADLRKRYENLSGIRGAETLNQLEKFTNQAAFASMQSEYRKILLHAGLRYDNNQIKVEDYFTADGVAEGALSLPSLSPSLSLSYNIIKYHFLSASYSFGFETPTLSELSSKPDNSGGFNTDLAPQKSNNYEVGYKAILSEKLSLTAAVFAINSRDELLPYELAEFPGRTFYRNAGKTVRKGLELSVKSKPLKDLYVNVAYTYSDFQFLDFDSFDGNLLPGIPQHNFAGTVEYRSDKWTVSYSLRMYSIIYADNANEVEVASFGLGSLSASRKIGSFRPYIGINNIHNNEDYYDNIRLNAFGGRYYEAGPPRNFYVGLKFEF